MSVTTRSKLLYICSDQQKQEESVTIEEPPKIIASARPKISRYNSHKLDHNLLQKGLFNGSTSNEDYIFQAKKQQKRGKIIVKETNKKTQEKVQKQPISNNPQCLQQIKHISQTLPTKKTVSNTGIMRLKTLVFNLPEQSDDQSSQKQEQKNQKQLSFGFDNGEQQKSQKPSVSAPFFSQQKQYVDIQLNNDKTNDTQNIQPQQGIAKKIKLTERGLNQKISRSKFLLNQIPQQRVIQCVIKKKNQFSNLLYSQFDMYFRNSLFYLASSKKVIANLSANYRISLQSDNFSFLNDNVLGKVREAQSNIYNIYDSGVNPSKYQYGSKNKRRQVLATVRIKKGFGPRQIQVYLLKQNVSYYDLRGVGIGPSTQWNLLTLYEIKENQDKILVFRSRKPQWDGDQNQYIIDFQGRICQPSIRNFILEDPYTGEQVLMFGKNCNNIYYLDIHYPLNPFLGFAIVMPQLDIEG